MPWLWVVIVVLLALAVSGARAQTVQQAGAGNDRKEKKEKHAKRADGDSTGERFAIKHAATLDRFFADRAIMPLTLTANFGRLRKERDGEQPWHWARLAFAGDSGAVDIPAQVRTRGIWRRKHCDVPPLGLKLEGKDTKGTPLAGQEKPKLVIPCRSNDDGYEQYVLQEMAAYRIYQLVTPLSHRARLVRVQLVDSASGKPVAQRYAIVLEEGETMAARNHGILLKQKGAHPADVEPAATALFGLFQYLIGNTDFSVSALHNVELVATDTSVYPVAHDFDWSGIVDARYASPDTSLRIRRVRDRLFRGFCVPPAAFKAAAARFDAQHDAIYQVYADSTTLPLDRGQAKRSREYLDDFYATLHDERDFKRSVVEACLGGG